jgi:prophage regulatory protein
MMKTKPIPRLAVLTQSQSTTRDQLETSGHVGVVQTTSIGSTLRTQASHPKSDRRLQTHCSVEVNDRPRIVRLPELSARLGLSVSSIYVLIAKSALPKPFALVPGGRAVGWLESDVAEFMLNRKDASTKEAV